MSHILTTPFSFPNFYDDIKILLRKYVMEKQGDEFEKLVDIQSRFEFIEKQRAVNQSKKYLVREIYDNLIVDLMGKKERLQKGLLLGYST